MIKDQSFQDQSPGSAVRSSGPFARLIVMASQRLCLAAFAAVELLRRSRMRQETAHVTAARKRLFEAAWHARVEVSPDQIDTVANEPRR